jgi:hypothetical protein
MQLGAAMASNLLVVAALFLVKSLASFSFLNILILLYWLPFNLYTSATVLLIESLMRSWIFDFSVFVFVLSIAFICCLINWVKNLQHVQDLNRPVGEVTANPPKAKDDESH